MIETANDNSGNANGGDGGNANDGTTEGKDDTSTEKRMIPQRKRVTPPLRTLPTQQMLLKVL